MGNGDSKAKASSDGAQKKQKGRGGEVSEKGDYNPDDFQTAAFDLKIHIEDSHALEETLAADITKTKRMALSYMRSKPKQKKRAIFALKLSKMKEKQLEDVRTRILTLQKMLDTVYGTKDQKEFVENLRAGNQLLKSLREGLDVDTVQKLLDEQKELEDMGEEIQDLIQESSGIVIDEDDMMSEIAGYEEEPASGTSAKAGEEGGELDLLPAAPTTDPAKTDEVELPDAPQHEPTRENDAEIQRAEAAAPAEERVPVAAD